MPAYSMDGCFCEVCRKGGNASTIGYGSMAKMCPRCQDLATAKFKVGRTYRDGCYKYRCVRRTDRFVVFEFDGFKYNEKTRKSEPAVGTMKAMIRPAGYLSEWVCYEKDHVTLYASEVVA